MNSADTVGAFVVLLCMALPLMLHMCSDNSRPADKNAVEATVRQHKIDSAQQRADSIRARRDSIREARRAAREKAREEKKKASAGAKPRSRLDEPVN